MIVDDLDVVSIPVFPDEADAKLIVDTDAVLPRAVPLERLKVVARDCREIAERGGDVQFPKPPLRSPLAGLKLRYAPSLGKSLSVLVAKALDHAGKRITLAVIRQATGRRRRDETAEARCAGEQMGTYLDC